MAQGTRKDRRFRQADREALLALFAYALYFIWWYVFAYGLGSGNPDDYSYVLGMPAWFFYSCIVGYPLITLTLWAIVRLFFKDMPLGEIDDDPGSPHGGASPSKAQDAKAVCPSSSVTDAMAASHDTCRPAPLAGFACGGSASAGAGEGPTLSVEPGDGTKGGRA